MQRIADSIFREGGLKEGVTAKADLEKKNLARLGCVKTKNCLSNLFANRLQK
jgi:hypothetical protein